MRLCRRIKYKGSYTVEAALLMPCILFVIFFVIYLGIYIHDRAVLRYAIISSSIKAAEGISEGNVNSTIDEITDKYVIGKWETLADSSINDEEVTVSLKGSMKYSQGIISSFISNRRLETDIELSTIKQIEVKHIRNK